MSISPNNPLYGYKSGGGNSAAFFEVSGLSLTLRVPGRQDPQNKAMGPFAKRYTALSEFNPQKASLRLQAAISLAFAPKVSKGRRTRRRLLMDYTFEDVSKLSALIFDGL